MKRAILALMTVLLGFGLAHADAPASIPDAQHGITLSPGEKVQLTLSPTNGAKAISRGPVGTIPDSVRQWENGVEVLKPMTGVGPKPAADMLTASLWSSDADGARLTVANGYSYPVIYNAFLVGKRNGQTYYRPTSICPIRPGQVGVESWPERIDGVVMANVHAIDPDHMACNDGSALSLAAAPAKDNAIYSCDAGRIMDPTAPVSVSVEVDSAGSVRATSAAWSLASGSPLKAPAIILDYPLLGNVASPTPHGLAVFAAIGLNPAPKAKAATVTLILNGGQKVSRPWRLYAKQMADLPTETARRPVAFAGVIPFVPNTKAGDPDLAALLNAVGKEGTTIEVRIVGDDGMVLSDGNYGAGRAPVRSTAVIDPLLSQALAKAKTPTQCQKQGG